MHWCFWTGVWNLEARDQTSVLRVITIMPYIVFLLSYIREYSQFSYSTFTSTVFPHTLDILLIVKAIVKAFAKTCDQTMASNNTNQHYVALRDQQYMTSMLASCNRFVSTLFANDPIAQKSRENSR